MLGMRQFLSRSACRGCRLSALRAVQAVRQPLVQYAKLPATTIRVRSLSTPPPILNVSDLSRENYHLLSDATMDILLESLESLLDSLGGPDQEVEYSAGVLTLKLGDKGTYVINKQPPNKQIWLSSPVSGPKRYDYSPARDNWFYARDGVALGDLLEKELSSIFDAPVRLGLEGISELVA